MKEYQDAMLQIQQAQEERSKEKHRWERYKEGEYEANRPYRDVKARTTTPQYDQFAGTTVTAIDPNAPSGWVSHQVGPPGRLTPYGKQVIQQDINTFKTKGELQQGWTQQNQEHANQLPPTQTFLMGQGTDIEKTKAANKMAWLKSYVASTSGEMPSEEEQLRAYQSIDRMYDQLQQNMTKQFPFMGNFKSPVTDAPPKGFIKREEGWYVNPNNPKDYWIADWKWREIQSRVKATGNR